MIFPLAGLLLGAVVGLLSARRKGGKLLDLAQWAAVYGVIFALIGLFILVFIERAAI